jgi:Family of unknown function (DUF5329)
MKRESKVEGRRSKVIRPLPLFCAALYFAASYSVGASRPAAEQAKIDWLLAEIRNSKATFIRNGNEYDASKAVSHLKTKLFFAGRRVQTVRQFIVGVASHSEETGKPYEIRERDGKQEPMGTWLLERLAVYEKGAALQRSSVPPTPPRTLSPSTREKG